MENLVIDIYKRSPEELKKNSSGRLRKSGYIPGVVYGLKNEPLNIKVEAKKFKDLIKGKGASGYIFDLRLKDDEKAKKISVLLKDFQKEPISREFSHLDFIRIKMEQEVTITIPIILENEDKAIGVKEEGGVIQHNLKEVEISCLPRDIPENIVVDVANLKIGELMRVSDLVASENIKVLSNPEEVVVSLSYATELKEEEEEVAEEDVTEEEPEVIKKEKAEKEEKE
jgi:large subunit ribosomal protein L25